MANIITETKNSIQESSFVKFLSIGGIVAAAPNLLIHNTILDSIETAGVLAGSFAVSKAIQFESSLTDSDEDKKLKLSAFLVVGGFALNAAASLIPGYQLINQFTLPILVGGLGSGAKILYNKHKNSM